MGQNDIIFIEIMAAIGLIGVVAFLIILVSRGPSGQRNPLASSSPWYGFFLAAVVLLIVVLLFLWRFPPSYMAQVADADWQLDSRAKTFFTIMLMFSAAALLVFVTYVIARLTRQPAAPQGATSALEAAPSTAAPALEAPTANYANPSGSSLLGLLALALAFAILNWSYVDHGEQYTLMVQLIYPAGFVMVLVMLFDKASRAWNIKTPGESLREWIFCNTFTFLFIVGYLNLLKAGGGDGYGAMIVDLVNVLVFLVMIWILDRKVTRMRFLVAYGYLILLPLALLIWQSVQGVEIPPETSWWETIWPFFSVAIIFFVLEIIVLIITRESRSQGMAIAKDLLFMVLYIICLIAAIPEAAAS